MAAVVRVARRAGCTVRQACVRAVQHAVQKVQQVT